MSDTTFLISGGFFDAVDSDRLYSADQMNQPYKKLIHDGINREADGTTPGFAVTAGGGMNVLVATGNAMIGGKWAENKAVQTIAVAGNTSGSARIDSIILQCDKSRAVRAVQIVYRQGTTAAPDLVSDDDITELRLANIRVPSAASAIASENITDTRGGAECPWVRSVFDAPDARYIVEEYAGSELAGAYQTVKSAVDSIRYAAQSGQPTVALQASDMIDSNLVYLYQGSETGYSTGYLYYYSDAAGAWIRGAQYGASVVDTALDEDSENPVQNKAIAVAIKTVRSFVVEVPGSAAAFSGSIAAGDFAKALATYTAGSGVYAVKDGEVYQLSAASSSTMTFTQMYHGTMNFIKQIQITSADTFTVTNTALSSSAADTSYNNTTSGLTATDVQAAIDENAAAVTNVNGRLRQLYTETTPVEITGWVQGYIRNDGTWGGNTPGTCRRGFISFASRQVDLEALTGHVFIVCEYTGSSVDAYVGRITPTYVNSVTFTADSAKKYAIAIKREDGADLPATDLPSNMLTYSYMIPTDTTLTESGKSADAKATGDAIAAVENSIPAVAGAVVDTKMSASMAKKVSKKTVEYIDLNWTQGKYIKSNGAIASGGTTVYATEEYIPVKVGRIIFLAYAVGSAYCALYNSDKTLRGEAFNISSEKTLEIESDGFIRLSTSNTVAPPGVAYLIQSVDQHAEVLDIEKEQLYSSCGYSTYNFIDSSKIIANRRLDPTTGLHVSGANHKLTGFIPVIPNALYRYNRPGDALAEVVCFYDKTLGFVSGQSVVNHNSYIQTPNDSSIAYMRFSVSQFPDNPVLYLVPKTEKVYHITPAEGILVGYMNAKAQFANVVVVDAGEYDILEEYKSYFGSDYFETYESGYNQRKNGSWDYGIFLENVSMRFSPGAIVTAEYDGTNANVVASFSAFAMGYNVEIDGLNLDCKNLRYAIHPDFWTTGQGFDKTPYLILRNSTLHNYRENDTTPYQNDAFGAGFPIYGNWLIENCIIKSDTNKHVIRIHNHASAGAKTKLTIRGCYIEGDGYIECNSYGASEEISEVLVYGCHMPHPVRTEIEGSGKIENVRIYSFANEITGE